MNTYIARESYPRFYFAESQGNYSRPPELEDHPINR